MRGVAERAKEESACAECNVWPAASISATSLLPCWALKTAMQREDAELEAGGFGRLPDGM